VSSQANAKISPMGGPTAALAARAAAGDRDAFAALYNEHHAMVFAYVLGKTRNRHLAEDLTADVFVRALRRIATFTTWRDAGFAGWLTTIARNIVIDYVKSSRAQREVLVDEVYDGFADRSIDTAEVAALRGLEIVEATTTVALAMQALNPYQRRCIQLRFFDGLSWSEIAVAMDSREGALKTLQYRAVATMRRALDEDGAVAA